MTALVQDDRKIDIKKEEFDKMLFLLSSLIKQNEDIINTMRENEKINRETYLSTIQVLERMSSHAKKAYTYTNSIMIKITVAVIIRR